MKRIRKKNFEQSTTRTSRPYLSCAKLRISPYVCQSNNATVFKLSAMAFKLVVGERTGWQYKHICKLLLTEGDIQIVLHVALHIDRATENAQRRQAQPRRNITYTLGENESVQGQYDVCCLLVEMDCDQWHPSAHECAIQKAENQWVANKNVDCFLTNRKSVSISWHSLSKTTVWNCDSTLSSNGFNNDSRLWPKKNSVESGFSKLICAHPAKQHWLTIQRHLLCAKPQQPPPLDPLQTPIRPTNTLICGHTPWPLSATCIALSLVESSLFSMFKCCARRRRRVASRIAAKAYLNENCQQ